MSTVQPATRENELRINDAADYLGVAAMTLRRWEARGTLVPRRTDGGQRVYNKAQLDTFRVAREKGPTPSQQDSLVTHPAPLLKREGGTPLPTLLQHRLPELLVTAGGTLLVLSMVIGVRAGVIRSEGVSFQTESPAKETPFGKTGVGSVLAAATDSLKQVFFKVNVPAIFKEPVTFEKNMFVQGDLEIDGDTTINGTTTFNDSITAPNVIYSLKAGDGIEITGGQNPTIASKRDQTAYSNIKVGSTTVAAGSATDTITFAAGGTVSVAIDTSTKKVTFTGAAADLSAAGGWTDGGTSVYLTTITDKVGIGTSTPATTLDITGTLNTTGAVTFGSTLDVAGVTTLANQLVVDGSGDVIQLRVQGNSTQTSNLFVLEQSDGTDVFAVGNTGALTLTDSGSSNVTVNLSGTGDFVIQDNGTTFVTFNSNGQIVGSDNLLINLSAATHNTSTPEGVILPQATSFTSPSSGEGYIAWDSDDNKLMMYNGSAWVDVAAAGGSLWTDGGTITYLTATSDDIAMGGATSDSPFFMDVSLSGLHLNPYGTSTGNTGEIDFEELEANGDNYTGFKAPDSLAGNVTYVLPSADATVSNQVLASSGAGVLSWINVSAGAGTLWTDGGAITYLTSTTDDMTVGGTTTDASLFFDQSLSALHLNPYNTTTGTTGEIDFEELEANGDNYTGFKAPDSLAGNVIYTLPSADGGANEVLATNASGTLSWISASGVSGAAWTKSSTNVYVTTTTDEVILGGTSPLSSAKLSIDGDSDQIQLIVQGFSTQTTDLAVFENSSGVDQFNFSNAGNFTAAGVLDINGGGTSDIAGTLNLSGTTLTASGDLTITPAGGDVILGASVALTASKVNKVIVVDGNTYAQNCAGINAAIDALGSSGGEIFLPEATYTCAETVTIDFNNTTIRGAGWGSIIDASAAALSPIINVSLKDRVTLKDFQVIGSAGGSGGNAINLRGDYNTADHLYIKNSDAYGIYVCCGDANGDLSGLISNNLIDNSDSSGIYVGEDRMKIIGNTFIDNGTGITTHNSGSGYYNVIADNTLNDGIGISGNSVGNLISNNKLTTIGISILAGANYNSVTGNTLTSMSGSYAFTVYGDYNSITGNTVQNCAPTSTFCGDMRGDYNLFSNNVYGGNDGTGTAIRLLVTASYNTFESNHFYNWATGITISGSTEDNNRLLNNTFSTVTTPISDSGTNTTIVNTLDGNTTIGGVDTSPDTTLELFRASGSDSTFSMTDGDVAHGVTTVVNTDAFFHIGPISSTVGGAYLQGLADATGVALQLRGIQSSDPTDTTPAVSIIGTKANGTGVQDLGAAETVFQVANNDDTAALTIRGSGYVGVGTVTPYTLLTVGAVSNSATTGNVMIKSTAEANGLTLEQAASSNLWTMGYALVSGNNAFTMGPGSSQFYFNAGAEFGISDADPDAYIELGNGDGQTNAFLISSTADADGDLFTIKGTGATGIGLNAPAGMLHVSSATTATFGKALAIFNHDEAEDLLTASASGVTKLAVSSTGALYVGDNTTLSTSTALCWESKTLSGATVYQVGDCTGTPADYAEIYPTAEDVTYGDVVSPGTVYAMQKDGDLVKHMIKSTTAYDATAIGVVSNNYHDFTSAGSDSISASDHPMPVALSGRVPVKVSPSSQAIKAGDFISTSSEAGKAMKATGAGYVIGKAVEDWDSSSGKQTVLLFVNNTYYMGSITNTTGATGAVSGNVLGTSTTDGQLVSESGTIDTLTTTSLLSDTIKTVNAEVLDTLTVHGQLVVEKEATFKEQTIFEKLVTFVMDVVFKGKVKFEQSPEFGRDSAGYAIIHKYTDRVDVVFDTEYVTPPVVTISLTDSNLQVGNLQTTATSSTVIPAEAGIQSQDATSSAFLSDGTLAMVTNVSGKGFSIMLPSPALRDYTYSWSAIRVSQPRVSESSTAVSDAMSALESQTASNSSSLVIPTSSTVIPAQAGIQSSTESGTLDSGSTSGMTGEASPSAQTSPSASVSP